MIVANMSIMRSVGFRSMKSRCASCAFILFCALSLLAPNVVAVTLASDTFVLAKPVLKTGDIRRLLRTVKTLDVRKGDEKHEKVVKFVEKYSRTVKAVNPDGSAVFLFQMEARQTFKDGKKVPPPNQPPVMTITRSSEGKMTVVANGEKIENGIDFQDPLNLAESLYPEKAITVGDHWPINYSIGTSKGLGQAQLTEINRLRVRRH